MDEGRKVGLSSTVGMPTFLPLFARTLGMASVRRLTSAVGIVPAVKKKSAITAKKMLWVAVAVDVFSGLMTTYGLVFVGSGVYTVIYSSTTAFTAVLSRLLGEKLETAQWISIAIITLGLLVNASAVLDASSLVAKNGTVQSYAEVVFGITLMLLGTILHAMSYIVNSYIIKKQGVSAFDLCSSMGESEAAILAAYSIGVSFLFGFSDTYAAVILDAPLAIVVFFGIMLMAALHALSFFAMLEEISPVSISILKALLAVTVFSFAAVLFCDNMASQCYSFVKAGGMMLVVFGSVTFVMSEHVR